MSAVMHICRFCLATAAAAWPLENWVRMNPRITQAPLSSLSFPDTLTGFAAGQRGTVVKTSDGGSTWRLLSTGSSLNLSQIHFSDSDIGYAWGEGILKTTDGGNLWAPIGEALGNPGYIQIVDAGTLYTVVASGAILKSRDGGSNWLPLPATPLSGPGTVHFTTPDSGVAGGDTSVFTTADGGANWIAGSIATRHPLDSYSFLDSRNGFALAGGFERIGDMGRLTGYIFRTTDGGSTWSQVHRTLDAVPTGRLHLQDTRNGMVASNDGTVLITRDGGLTWTPERFVLDFAPNAIAPVWPNHVFASGGSGQLARSADRGVTWSGFSQGSTAQLNSVHFTHPDSGVAVGEQGEVLATHDGGRTWRQAVSLGQALNAVHRAPSGLWFAVGRSGGLFRSEDGLAWSSPLGPERFRDSNNDDEFLLGMDFPSASTGYIVTNRGTVLKINRDGTQVTRSTAAEDVLTGVDFLDSLTGYVVGAGGAIARTRDGGTSWTNLPSGTLSLLNDVSFPGPDIGYAVGEGGAILKTLDGGSTWSRQDSRTGAFLRSVEFINPDTGYAAGPGLILVTRNGGSTWAISDSSTLHSVNALHILPGGIGYAVGSSGLVLKLAGSGPVSLRGARAVDLESWERNGWLHFTLPSNGRARARLYDARGSLIRILFDDARAAGRYREAVFARPVPPGMYILELQAGSVKRTLRLRGP